jgi:hypothetical protein
VSETSLRAISPVPAADASARQRSRAAALVDAVRRAFDDATTFDIAAAMTCLVLVSYAESLWFIRIPVLALGVAAIVYRPLARRAAYWFLVSGVLSAGYLVIWYTIDNHKYLTAYWCLALAVSLVAAHPLRAAAVNARLLIGLCFLFAVVWKVISLEFVDGTFFHFSLVSDPRFRNFSALVGGVSADALASNSQALAALVRGGGAVDAVAFHSSERVAWLAQLIALWTIAIEGLIAVAFLWPEGRALSKWRDAVLLLFLITTYPIATVPGFGWLLVAMGMAQSSARWAFTRPLYVFTFALHPLFLLPFGHIIRVVQDRLL